MLKILSVSLALLSTVAFAHELSFGNYLKAQEALAADDFKTALNAHEKICSEELGHYTDDYSDCKKKFNDIGELRNSFKKLSKVFLKNGKAKELEGLQKVNCSMAKADWVQKKGEIANPYYGSSMLRCGEKI